MDSPSMDAVATSTTTSPPGMAATPDGADVSADQGGLQLPPIPQLNQDSEPDVEFPPGL